MEFLCTLWDKKEIKAIIDKSKGDWKNGVILSCCPPESDIFGEWGFIVQTAFDSRRHLIIARPISVNPTLKFDVVDFGDGNDVTIAPSVSEDSIDTNALKSEIALLKASCDSYVLNIKSLTEDIDKLQRASSLFEQEAALSSSRIAELEKLLDESRQQTGSALAEIERVNNSNDGLNQNIAQLNENITNLNAEIAQLKSSLKESSERVEAEKVAHDVDSLKLAESQDNLLALQGTIDDLRKDILDKESQLEALRRKLEEFSKLNDELVQAKQANEISTQDLQLELDGAYKQIAAKAQEIHDINVQLNTKMQENNEMQGELIRFREGIPHFNGTLIDEITHVRVENDQLSLQNKVLEKENLTLKSDNQILRSKLKEWEEKDLESELVKEVKQLISRIAILTVDHELLLSFKERIMMHDKELISESERVRNFHEKLQYDIKDEMMDQEKSHQQLIHEMNAKILVLQKEIDQLKTEICARDAKLDASSTMILKLTSDNETIMKEVTSKSNQIRTLLEKNNWLTVSNKTIETQYQDILAQFHALSAIKSKGKSSSTSTDAQDEEKKVSRSSEIAAASLSIRHDVSFLQRDFQQCILDTSEVLTQITSLQQGLKQMETTIHDNITQKSVDASFLVASDDEKALDDINEAMYSINPTDDIGDDADEIAREIDVEIENGSILEDTASDISSNASSPLKRWQVLLAKRKSQHDQLKELLSKIRQRSTLLWTRYSKLETMLADAGIFSGAKESSFSPEEVQFQNKVSNETVAEPKASKVVTATKPVAAPEGNDSSSSTGPKLNSKGHSVSFLKRPGDLKSELNGVKMQLKSVMEENTRLKTELDAKSDGKSVSGLDWSQKDLDTLEKQLVKTEQIYETMNKALIAWKVSLPKDSTTAVAHSKSKFSLFASTNSSTSQANSTEKSIAIRVMALENENADLKMEVSELQKDQAKLRDSYESILNPLSDEYEQLKREVKKLKQHSIGISSTNLSSSESSNLMSSPSSAAVEDSTSSSAFDVIKSWW